MYQVRVLREPTILVLAEQQLKIDGLKGFVRYLKDQGGCGIAQDSPADQHPVEVLFRHGGRREVSGQLPELLTDNEMLCEVAGRKCYNSFGEKIGHSANDDYIANILGAPGKIPHASVLYHAKMTFFFAGISRRMTHELIRHYVGADRSEEGCPSQESTRYTEHPGHFVAHPRILDSGAQLIAFEDDMTVAYSQYRRYVDDSVLAHESVHGVGPKGMDRKRIYEAAASYLPGCASTSMVWTTNPVALQKIFFERCDEAADLEFQRFAKLLRGICHDRWPNLFRESNPAAAR